MAEMHDSVGKESSVAFVSSSQKLPRNREKFKKDGASAIKCVLSATTYGIINEIVPVLVLSILRQQKLNLLMLLAKTSIVLYLCVLLSCVTYGKSIEICGLTLL